MPLIRRALVACLCALGLHAQSGHAQASFPPEALKSATSLAAALSAMGVGGAEPSGYLLLDAPDIAAPGAVKAKATSEIPGTVYLILLRGSPANPTAPPTSGQLARPSKKVQRNSPPPAIQALVAAQRFAPGRRATLHAEFEVGASQWMTLIAFAQGRWFVAAREIKVGKAR